MANPSKIFSAIIISTTLLVAHSVSSAGKGVETITLIHFGDLHGQLAPDQNVRSDNASKREEGGLARIATTVKKIRSRAEAQGRSHFTFLVGDVTQGGFEVSFTRGKAMVDVLNMLDIDLTAQGNWDFTYGTCRTDELWGFTPAAKVTLAANPRIKDMEDFDNPVQCSFAKPRLANFESIASNAYVDDDRNSANCPPAGTRQRIQESYKILEDPVSGLKLGVIGFTTERGPRVIGNPVVEGLCFTKGDEEIIELGELMKAKKDAGEVHAVIMLSELGLGNNRRVIELAESDPGVGPGVFDVVLSADMHEETTKVFHSASGETALVEQGCDGWDVGEIDLSFKNEKLVDVRFKQHPIEESIKQDPETARLIDDIREEFIDGSSTARHFIHGLTIPAGVQEPLGTAGLDLNRSNFTHESTAGIYEGTFHSLMTDAVRETVKHLVEGERLAGNLDSGAINEALCAEHNTSGNCIEALPVLGVIRGFRYGTSVPAGEAITLEKLYQITPIGPFATFGVATGEVILGRGAANNQAPTANGLEHAAHLSLSPNLREWGGGWLQNYSGMIYSINPYAAKDARVSDVLIGNDEEAYTPIDPGGRYIVAGYAYNDVLFGTDSGANEYVFVNKPLKMNQAGTANVWRVVFDTDSLTTLDPANELGITQVPFGTNGSNPAINSLPVVDLVARYLLSQSSDVALKEPVSRVNVLCHQPDFARVVNTKNSQIIDPEWPISDVGFPLTQSIFGANKNLIQYLNNGRLQGCVDNGIIDIQSGKIEYLGD
jgi:sulfur-oxidizing protein SoxB